MFRPRPVSFLRSNLLIVIVSLCVATGYAHEILDACCEGQRQEQAAQGRTPADKNAPAQDDGCQCLCHQFFTAQAVLPLSAAPAIYGPADFVAQRDEFPPEAVPLGIDYPPQLA